MKKNMRKNTLLIVQHDKTKYIIKLQNDVTKKIEKFLNAINILNGILNINDILRSEEKGEDELKLVILLLFKLNIIDGSILINGFGMKKREIEKEMKELDAINNIEILMIEEEKIKIDDEEISEDILIETQESMKFKKELSDVDSLRNNGMIKIKKKKNQPITLGMYVEKIYMLTFQESMEWN